MQVVADTKADSRPMHRRIVIQTSIEGHVGFDSKDDRFGAGFFQLEQRLPLCVPPEVFPFLIQAKNVAVTQRLCAEPSCGLGD